MLLDHVAKINLNYSFSAIYIIFNAVGRIAFPIFAFCIIEGYVHTSNIKKYIIRLFWLFVFSEPFYDFAFCGENMFSQQNVFLTLVIGIILILFIDKLQKLCFNLKQSFLGTVLYIIFIYCICVTGWFAGNFLKCDYLGAGIISIIIMYLLRQWKNVSVVIAVLFLIVTKVTSVYALLAVVPISLYNGDRGNINKWIFYIFYPVHLLILTVIDQILSLF